VAAYLSLTVTMRRYQLMAAMISNPRTVQDRSGKTLMELTALRSLLEGQLQHVAGGREGEGEEIKDTLQPCQHY
jgi:hypothetical protein